jgi:hypothetical protein
LGYDTNTIQKNKETEIDANTEFGLEVNAEKTYVLISHQNAAQNYNNNIANRILKMWQSSDI